MPAVLQRSKAAPLALGEDDRICHSLLPLPGIECVPQPIPKEIQRQQGTPHRDCRED